MGGGEGGGVAVGWWVKNNRRVGVMAAVRRSPGERPGTIRCDWAAHCGNTVAASLQFLGRPIFGPPEKGPTNRKICRRTSPSCFATIPKGAVLFDDCGGREARNREPQMGAMARGGRWAADQHTQKLQKTEGPKVAGDGCQPGGPFSTAPHSKTLQISRSAGERAGNSGDFGKTRALRGQ